jgi:hypothetical protein
VLEAFYPGYGCSDRVLPGAAAATGKPEFSAETKAAMEDLFALELEDDGGPSVGGNFSLNNLRFHDPRRCDLAATLLATAWPEKYSFDPTASLVVREQQRCVALNAYRTIHGLASIAFPATRPPVLPEDTDEIAEVDFVGGEIKSPPAVLEFLRTAKGKRIDAKFLQALRQAFLDACASQRPRADQGLVVEALRESDHLGVTLMVSPAERSSTENSRERPWLLEVRATLDEKTRPKQAEEHLFEAHEDRKTDYAFEARLEGMGFYSPKGLLQKVAELPREAPFRLTIEFAPGMMEEDRAY